MKTSTRRRELLRGLLAASVTSPGLLGALGTLSRAQAAATLAQPDDYRALVTVFLFGGNDGFNMLVPTDGRYGNYATARRHLAVPQTSLLGLNGTGLGLHPNMPGLQGLYNQGKVAMGLNIGPMLEYVNRSQFLAGSAALPPQLFSHEQQQIHWQTANPSSLVNHGWLGRANDLLATAFSEQSLPFGVSLLGSNTLQVGANSVGYAVEPEGPLGLEVLLEETPLSAVHEQILNLPYSHPLMAEHVRIRRRSQGMYEQFASAFATLPTIQTVFPAGELGQQLLGVARFMAVQRQLGIRRQNFFVGIGGFDTHGNQAGIHPGLLTALDTAITAFHGATVELGLEQNVVLATLSEFGRTLTINGDGTDHGWGGHQFVVGGPVQGGVYGQFPDLTVEGPDDGGEGRLIPTTATEEFAAPLMRWFGVPESDMPVVFPNLGRFNDNLGFLG